MEAKQRDPDSDLDWPFDWSAWLADGETIATAVVTVPAGLTKSKPDEKTDTRVTVWISGGTALQSYTVSCRITTSQGRVDERSLRLQTVER